MTHFLFYTCKIDINIQDILNKLKKNISSIYEHLSSKSLLNAKLFLSQAHFWFDTIFSFFSGKEMI